MEAEYEIDKVVFWGRINKNGPIPEHVPHLGHCWIWPRKGGYGQLKVPNRRSPLLAHRVAFYLTHGHWPTPCCCHRCDNALCVRPSHLFEGTYADNTRDMFRKGRQDIEGIRKSVKALWDDPEYRAKMTESHLKYWSDPELGAKRRAARSKSQKEIHSRPGNPFANRAMGIKGADARWQQIEESKFTSK